MQTERRNGDAPVRAKAIRQRPRAGTTPTQKALRRIASCVAEGVQAHELFAVVAEEVHRVIGAPSVGIARFESDGSATVCAVFPPQMALFPTGTRVSLEGTNVLGLVRQHTEPARIDSYAELEGEIGSAVQAGGMRSSVGVPVPVAGRLWGAIVAWDSDRLPDGTEDRLAEFTQLLAATIANTDARESLARLADEQAALRRVATLVAQDAAPAEIFSAVSVEVDRVFQFDPATFDVAGVVRFEPGPELAVVGVSKTVEGVPLGARFPPEELFAPTHVLRTGRSARIDERDLASAGGDVADFLRHHGYLSQVASPIVVEGRLWGAISVNSRSALPPDTDQRLERFTELVATAIANAESHDTLARLAQEQAALRRVATLVARDAPPSEVFATVAMEVGTLLDTDVTVVGRYDADGAATATGSWSASPGGVPVGTRAAIGGRNVLSLVAETKRPARIDSYDDASGEAAEIGRRHGWRSSIAAPISVEDRLWGVMLVATRQPEPFRAGAEERLSAFTELVATAIANAESTSALAASRRRIVAASDDARRRIERDLHDGVQQQLVVLGLQLGAMKADPPSGDTLKEQLAGVTEHVDSAFDSLVEIARGIHPAILSQGGLTAALKSLARRSAVPVQLDAQVQGPLPDEVEVAAYYVVAEALTNVVKHARADVVHIDAVRDDTAMTLVVRDDGVGGADLDGGSGLVGLQDRVEALGGTIEVDSPPGAGTRVVVTLPTAASAA